MEGLCSEETAFALLARASFEKDVINRTRNVGHSTLLGVLCEGRKENIVPKDALDLEWHEDLPTWTMAVAVKHAREADENIDGRASICYFSKDGVRDAAEGCDILDPLSLARVTLLLGRRIQNIHVDVIVFANGRSLADGGSEGELDTFEDLDLVGDPYDAVDVDVDDDVFNGNFNRITLDVEADVSTIGGASSKHAVEVVAAPWIPRLVAIEKLGKAHERDIAGGTEDEVGSPDFMIGRKIVLCPVCLDVLVSCKFLVKLVVVEGDGIRRCSDRENVFGSVPGRVEVVHVSKTSKQTHALVCKARPADRHDKLCDRIESVHGMDLSETVVVDDHLLTSRARLVVVKRVVVLYPTLLVGSRKGRRQSVTSKALGIGEGDVFDGLVLVNMPADAAWGSLEWGNFGAVGHFMSNRLHCPLLRSLHKVKEILPWSWGNLYRLLLELRPSRVVICVGRWKCVVDTLGCLSGARLNFSNSDTCSRHCRRVVQSSSQPRGRPVGQLKG